MSQDMTSMLIVFGIVASLAMIAGLFLVGPNRKLSSRIDQLVGKEKVAQKPETVVQIARSAIPKMGQVLAPEDEEQRTKLRARLVHAGLYHRQAMYVFLGVKLLILGLAVVVGLGVSTTGVLSLGAAMMVAMGLFIVGMVGPSFWLDKRKGARQTLLRRGLPDAMDVLIICLEGGLGFQAALKRVADELRDAHPALGAELRIADREVRLGRSPSEAIQHLAERTDLEEIQSLSSIISQSEKFGASLVKSLRGASETLRHRRKQKAEEKAQKAATKILMPTLLFIFPAVFVILLAPAIFQVLDIFSTDKK